MAEIIRDYDLEPFESLERDENKNKLYNLAETLINDVTGTETRTTFIKDTLNGNFNKDELENIITFENNKDLEENLRGFFDLAKKLDPEELKSIYDNLVWFYEIPKSIEEKNWFTSNKILEELTE